MIIRITVTQNPLIVIFKVQIIIMVTEVIMVVDIRGIRVRTMIIIMLRGGSHPAAHYDGEDNHNQSHRGGYLANGGHHSDDLHHDAGNHGNQGINSEMLDRMHEHGNSGDSANHPTNHAQNMGGWNTPMFINNLDSCIGLVSGSIDMGLSGNLNNHGPIDAVKKGNEYTDVAGAFNGTALGQGSVGHEGFDLKPVDASVSHFQPDIADFSGIHNTSGKGGGGSNHD